MSYDNFKIKESDISTHGVVAAPDRLTGTAQENKAVFDRLIKMVVAQKFNSFIEQVMAEIESIEVPPKGFSAYEVAVENGFKGSAEEWLDSLRAERLAVASFAVTEAEDTTTIVSGFEDGSEETVIISFGSEGQVTGINVDGVTIPVSWTEV